MAADMQVSFAGLNMQNPVNTASGTFGFGAQFERFFDVSQLGAITCKGCSAEVWEGNPAPRMAKVASGMMNSVGLQNPSIKTMVESYGSYLQGLEERGCRVIVQACGHSVEEYVSAVELYQELAPWASAIELNISCPNISKGGAAQGSTPEGAAEVMCAVRDRTRKPLIVKMGPVRVGEIARALEAEGADALSLINTIPGMAIDVRTRRSKLSRPTAGVSGPAIHAIATAMVWEASKATTLPICGIGGVASWQDAAEMILAGATCVAVGTASFYRPCAALEVASGLERWVEESGAKSVSELRGALEC